MKYKTFTLTIILSILFGGNLSAQWDALGDNIVDTNHRIWSLKIAPDRSVWATASFDSSGSHLYSTKVYRSIDEGNTWERLLIAEGLSKTAYDISPIDMNNAFVTIHNNGGLFKTIDGGQSWIKINSYTHNPAYVHFFNMQEGWVLGYDGNNLIMNVTEDGGETWIEISYHNGMPSGTSLPPNLLGESINVFRFSTSSTYAIHNESIMLGTRGGNVWVSKDKGKNWARKSTPLANEGLHTSNIAMKDETTFMVAGNYLNQSNSTSEAMNFTTTDDGLTWISGNPGVTAAASHYLPNSDSIFIMVGHNDFGQGDVGTAISYDYGENWKLIDNTSMIAMDFLDENTGYGSCCNNFWETANGQIHKWNFDLSTSTFEIVKHDKVTLSPNPVHSQLTISLNNEFQTEALMVEIISANGKVVSEEQFQANEQIDLSTSNLPNGFYVLKISSQQKSVVKKFIKE